MQNSALQCILQGFFLLVSLLVNVFHCISFALRTMILSCSRDFILQ